MIELKTAIDDKSEQFLAELLVKRGLL